ncbi:MAG: hypothetical protein KA524_08530 [Nitrosomonas sp.]|nr:hypothetical protein [Nitrosomonas sp.]MBP6076707.1 hypothetical protein [Nitrosomonas sp.]
MKRGIKALSKVDKQTTLTTWAITPVNPTPWRLCRIRIAESITVCPIISRFEYCQREGAIKGRERTHQGKVYNGKTPREALLSSKSV